MKNIKTFVSISIFLVHLTSCFSQTYNFGWAFNIGSTNFDAGNSIVSDSQGNAYTVGYFNGTVDFDPGVGIFNLSSAGSYDVFVSKTDPTGNFVWAVKIGGSLLDMGRAIDIDASGNLYITGDFRGTVDFDPGSGVFNLVSGGAEDGFILKLDSNGGFVWAKKIGGTDSDTGRSLVVDDLGNSYLIGEFSGTVDFDPGVGVSNLTSNGWTDVFILKLDATGNFGWAKNVGGTSFDYVNSIAIDEAGNSYIVGQFSGTVDFNPGTGTTNLTAVGANDGFILKLDVSGNFVWVRQISGSGNEYIIDITLDNSGNIYYTGQFNGTVDVDPGIAVLNLTSVGIEDFFLSKLDAAGNFVWAKGIGGTGNEGAQHISINGSNRIHIAGYFENTVDFDPGLGVANLTSSGSWDPFIAEFDELGNFIWVQKFGGPGNDACNGLDYDQLGNIYTTGFFASTADFDPGSGVFNLSAIGQSDIFLQKLIRTCPSTTSTLSVSQCSTYTVPSGHETYSLSGTYMDTIPNTAGCDSIITINLTIGDAVAPVANTPSLVDVTAQCSVESLTAPTAIDNCTGTITGTTTTTFPITTQGTTVVTWTYDDGNGNTSIQTQNVTITDNTAPVANTTSLADITNQCSVTSLTAPTAADNCEGTITGTHNATLPITTQGTTVVTWTYDDGNGNTSTQTQNVVITDNIPPVVNVASLADITNQCSVTSLTAPTATDNCAGTITGTTSTTFPITTSGTTVVTWTYNDGNGNTSSQTQNVIVTVPVATTTLSGLTITATTSGATYQWINCGTGNTPISGATSQSYTATANGTYAVIVTQNGCSATSACVTVSTVGIVDNNFSGITLFPNPTSGIVQVSFENDLSNATINLVSTSGQLINQWSNVTGNSFEIDLSKQVTGMYFIEIRQDDRIIRVKVNKL